MTKGIDFTSMSRVETDRYQYACADKARACIVMAHKYITDGLRASEEHPVVRRKLVNMRTVIEEGILNTTACIVTPEDVAEKKPFVLPELEKGDWGVIMTDRGHIKSRETRDKYIAEQNAKRGFKPFNPPPPPDTGGIEMKGLCGNPFVIFPEAVEWAKATYRRIFNAK